MRILIVEDEYHAAKRLESLILSHLEQSEILAVLDSVEDAVAWFKENEHPDLIFMDIQLADGISFSIFQQVEVNAPIIFTTAFDQYSLKAFKVNSIDYLLKPIDEKELVQALEKYHKINKKELQPDIQSLGHLIQNMNIHKTYKERFLLKSRDKYYFLLSEEIAYFYSEDSLTFIVTNAGKSYVYDASLNHINEALNPNKFFRINRKQIVHIQSISKIHNYFNNRIKLELKTPASQDFIVSRDNVKEFKTWMGG